MEIDYKKILEDLSDKYDELEGQYKAIKDDWIGDFEGTQDYHAYMSYTEDEVKKTMYPEWFEKEQKMNELKVKLEAFDRDGKKLLQMLHKQLDESIKKLEEKLKVNEEYIKGLDEKIEKQQKELETLEESEEYLNGDEATKLQVEELRADLVGKRYRREEVMKNISSIKKELTEIKKEKEKVIKEYGEEIESEEVSVEENLEGNENPEEVSKDGDETKGNKSKGKNARASNDGVVLPDANSIPAELSAEEKAKKEQEEKDKKLKEDFADLSSKAKKGKLTDKELDDFVTILKDKDNYEKLGLSMGLIFNKPRGIFKALNKKYKDDEAKLASINEAYSVYEEKFFEKHGKEKLEKLSKFFVIDEVEHKGATKALPEKVEIKTKKKSLGDDLAGKTVKDGDYVDISSTSKVKTEQTKEEI